ncbi:MAG: hypothetical protein HC904_08515 [Blastochloris sp.]|nr:hypothetical protein [Blastochloris sp.]
MQYSSALARSVTAGTDFFPQEPDPVQQRQSDLTRHLLQPLGEHTLYRADPKKGSDTLSNRTYLIGYQARLQHHHLSLLLNHHRDAANHYYETNLDLDSRLWNGPRNEPDWKLMPLTRAFHQCHDFFSPPARERIRTLLLEGRQSLGFGGTENHIINRATLVHLIDPLLGHHDAKTDHARRLLLSWIHQRRRRGFMEFNSPTYHRHSLLPLLELFDLSADEEIKHHAEQLLHQAFSLIALTSIRGVRGGPWHRFTRMAELSDKRDDVVALIAHLYFGSAERPPIITEGATWATTDYRPPSPIPQLATEIEARGSYEVRQRLDTVRPELNSIHWVTPSATLGSFSGAVPSSVITTAAPTAPTSSFGSFVWADPAVTLDLVATRRMSANTKTPAPLCGRIDRCSFSVAIG